MISKRRIVGIKQEATQGAGATFAVTDYILADVEFPDYQFENLERDYQRASYSTLPHVVGKKTVAIKIKTELKGSGTAGVPYAPLSAAIQACAYTETLLPAITPTSVNHLPLTVPVANFIGPGKSVCIEICLGGTAIGTKHIIKGCVGTWKISGEINKLAMIEFDFKGQYVTPATADLPSTTYLPQLPVVWQNSTISIHGFGTANVKKWEIDAGNDIQLNEDSTVGKDGIGGWFVAGRKPKASIELLTIGLATFDPRAIAASGAIASASLTVGTIAGNIITLTMPKTQLDKKYGELNSQITDQLSLIPSRDTGDDWLRMVIT